MRNFRLTKAEIQTIHLQLRYLANICDGAVKLDGMGFNKFDAERGYYLAYLDELTEEQAEYAQRMLIKYHKQLDGIEWKK